MPLLQGGYHRCALRRFARCPCDQRCLSAGDGAHRQPTIQGAPWETAAVRRQHRSGASPIGPELRAPCSPRPRASFQTGHSRRMARRRSACGSAGRSAMSCRRPLAPLFWPRRSRGLWCQRCLARGRARQPARPSGWSDDHPCRRLAMETAAFGGYPG